MTKEKNTYLVKSPVVHDMQRYEVGDEIELESKVARALLIAGAIEKLPRSAPPPADPNKGAGQQSEAGEQVPGTPPQDPPVT